MSYIKNYKKIKLLGEGAFGKTFLAEKEGKEFAIKIFKDRGTRSFSDESLILRRILPKCQEYLVCIVETFTLRGEDVIVMQFVPDSNELGKLIKENKLVSRYFNYLETIIAYKLILGLSTLHKLGIAHRDIKPENILVINNNKTIKIKYIDYGLSFIKGSIVDSIAGTYQYMAPEVISGRIRTFQDLIYADIWSLGITLYVLTYKDFPDFILRSRNYIEYLKNMNSDPLIRRMRDPLYSPLDYAIERMVKFNPRERIPLNELIKFFRKFLCEVERDIIKIDPSVELKRNIDSDELKFLSEVKQMSIEEKKQSPRRRTPSPEEKKQSPRRRTPYNVPPEEKRQKSKPYIGLPPEVKIQEKSPKRQPYNVPQVRRQVIRRRRRTPYIIRPKSKAEGGFFQNLKFW